VPASVSRAVVLLSLALAACGDPAARCNANVEEMKAKLVGVVGAAHKDSADPLVKAHTFLDLAQMALATGNVHGCEENVKAAKALLAQSGR
jgi:hypothetical protein